jgi:protein-S-isoprenylcysteine O-methyltransferase Ste14
VVEDLYRFNRNPMYLGVSMILLGWALTIGNPWLFGYFAIVPSLFHLRIVLNEEHVMRSRFPDEWSAYSEAVPRWGTRLRAWNPEASRSS